MIHSSTSGGRWSQRSGKSTLGRGERNKPAPGEYVLLRIGGLQSGVFVLPLVAPCEILEKFCLNLIQTSREFCYIDVVFVRFRLWTKVSGRTDF